jgi:DNA adenine methylase
MTLSTPLKTHGGKAYLASRITGLFPPRDQYLAYVEPYFGGGSVLLAHDPEGKSEVVNDLDNDLSTFWKVLQSPADFYAFQRVVEATPFSEDEWKYSDIDHDQCPSPVEIAVAFFVRCRQSLAGRKAAFAPLSRTRVRRGMNEQASAWLGAVEGLPAVHARLKRVVVLNRPALDVIASQDGPRTLFYLDPPYLPETRASTGEYGYYEMSADDHGELLEALGSLKGKFLLSGYRSDLYDDWAQACGWSRHEFDMANNAAGGAEKRRMTECLWRNFQ